MRQVVDGIELVSPCAVAAFDGSIELRPLWRQDEKVEPLVVAACSKPAMNSEPPSTWMPLTLNGISARTLSRKLAAREAVARPVTPATVHLATGQ